MTVNISALRDVAPKEAISRLAASVKALLPRPLEVEEAPGPESDPILAELAQTLGAELRTLTPDERVSLLKLLTDAILEAGRVVFDLDAAHSALGAAGHLKPSAYALSFAGSFRGYGVQRNHIVQAVRHAHSVEHLHSPVTESNGIDGLSMFLHAIEDSRRAQMLLVVAMRTGAELSVMRAWRVYGDLVDCRDASRPMDVLRAFAERYGLYFQIGDRAPTKFLEHDVVRGRQADIKVLPPIGAVATPSYDMVWVGRGSRLGVTEVSVAHCIDTERYERDIKRKWASR